MINIKNKLESDSFILKSGMNYTPFKLVSSYLEVYDYLKDLDESKLPVSIRFKGKGMQPFIPNLSISDCLKYCFRHFLMNKKPDILGIYEATEGYDDYRTINCEIRINPDLTVDAHYCRGNMKMRDALASQFSKHAVGVDLDFKPLRWAIEYCCKFNLIGCVVELTLFSKPVGVKKENIVCWEVRNF